MNSLSFYFRCISDLMAGQNFVPPDMIFLQLIHRFLTVNKIMSRKGGRQKNPVYLKTLSK